MLRLQNPSIPFNGSFNGSVAAGFNLTVTGYPIAGANRFSINLMDQGSMHILHFNPRFPEKAIVLNSRPATGWGPEKKPPSFPFAPNTIFRISFQAQAHAFNIFVNDVFLADYNHRLPMSSIKFINISGDVMVQEINASSPGSVVPVPVPVPVPAPVPTVYVPVQQPMACPAASPFKNHMNRRQFGNPRRNNAPIHITSPSVPLTIQLPGNLQEQMVFNIKAAPTSDFSFNWLCENGDKAFIFDVKFNVYQPRSHPQYINKIIRNSFQFGKAGAEQSDVPFFPFVVNMNFDLDIVCQSNFYEVRVNGQPIFNFNHRIYPVSTVSSFMVQGGLKVSSVIVRG